MSDRSSGLGASDAAPACGLSKWKTPLQLYREKIGEADKFVETFPMSIGKALESVILQQFSTERGLTLTGMQQQVIDAENPWRWVTLDALVPDLNALVEAKASGWGTGFTDSGIPMEYALQVQHALACTNLRLAFVPVLIAGRDFRIYEVHRDDEMIDDLTKLERAFWDRVQARNPPEPSTLAEVNSVYKVSESEKVSATEQIALALKLVKDGRAKIKETEEFTEELESQIKLALKGADTLVDIQGNVLATWKSQTSNRLDQKALQEAMPEIAKQFTRASPSRVFRIK